MSIENSTSTPSNPSAGEETAEACRMPEEMAADAVRAAKIELEKAQQCYEAVRREAERKVHELSEKKIGELIDCTLDTVKRNPASSLLVSAALGYFLGRCVQKFFK
jgi:ElaB/YqjD/DUF883 family membrane-anchored ribosome-binding protein